jgi:hypothetical protein
MATVSISLTDIVLKAYLSVALPLEEVVVTSTSGVAYITIFDDQFHCYLQLNAATNARKLRPGEMVTASGNDPDGRLFALSFPLETVSTGTPAVFRGPVRGGP